LSRPTPSSAVWRVTRAPWASIGRAHTALRNIVGSILWPTRCTAPELGYAASILSKCMASPPETAWRAALHVAHWMHTHKSEGITFSSHGNLEPVCYYDSGYKQKHLFDKPQYGYVIFWGGAPIIWQSKRHTQVPQSVSQAEFETLTHAWRDVKWLREFIKEMGLGKYVERPQAELSLNFSHCPAQHRTKRSTPTSRFWWSNVVIPRIRARPW
jgi:hypothetical protein